MELTTENKEDIILVIFSILFFPLIIIALISDWFEK
jgi:hypothetical protein